MNRSDQIKALHDLASLSFYSNWLSYVLEVIDSRFKLSADEETVLANYVDILQKHIESRNQKVSYRLFLEIACFIPEKFRRKDSPLIVLNPAHGGFSEPRLREAENWVSLCETRIMSFYTLSTERLNRMLNYTGLAQPVVAGDVRQLIVVLTQLTEKWKLLTPDADLIALYRILGDDEAHNLAAYSISLLTETKNQPFNTDDRYPKCTFDERVSESILKHLAIYKPDALQPFHPQMLEHAILYPAYLFRSALASTTTLIRDELEYASIPDLQHRLLETLVWSNNAEVQQYLSYWLNHRPAWWDDTYKHYSLEAGWELTEAGERVDLYFETCFQLIPYDTPQTTRVFVQREDHCPWCQQPLEDMLILDLRDSRLEFLGLSGHELRVLTCPSCLPWTPIFAEVNYEGKAAWSAFNSISSPLRSGEYLPIPNMLGLAPVPRNPLESYVLENGHSQIGGLPRWVNDASYLPCPKCGRSMCFIGQVQTSDIMPGEGWTYAFLCQDCRIAGTSYDQT